MATSDSRHYNSAPDTCIHTHLLRTYNSADEAICANEKRHMIPCSEYDKFCIRNLDLSHVLARRGIREVLRLAHDLG